MQARDGIDASTSLAGALVTALNERSFFQKGWETERVHLARLFSAGEVERLFPMREFEELLTSGVLRSPHLDIVRNGQKEPAPLLSSPSPATDAGATLGALAGGATLRGSHIEHYLPRVRAFCQCLERALQMAMRVNVYATPPFSQGFGPHFDLDDIFVVQVAGEKSWILHTEYAAQEEAPNGDMPFDPMRHQAHGSPDCLRLGVGDVLYLPRGFMHEARTGSSGSIHLTFAAIGTKLSELVQQMVRALAVTDARLRRTLPVQGLSHEELLATLQSEIRSCLDRLSDTDTLELAIGAMQRSFASHRNPDLRGHLPNGLGLGRGA